MLKKSGIPTRQLQSCVIWRRILDDLSDEFCAIRQQDGKAEVEGTLVGLTAKLEPFCCSYRILANLALSQSRRLTVCSRSPTGIQSLSISRSAGGWKVDGEGSAFIEADEIDLQWSPVTNMFPIRQMLERGVSSLDVTVAWVRAPELRVERSMQRYDRIDDLTARYTNLESGFTALISHDHEGLPLDYEGVWKQRSYWSNAA